MYQKYPHVSSREQHAQPEVLKEQYLREEQHLEERLAAYYGPALPPHALPEAAWARLQSQLKPPVTRERQVQHISFPRLTRARSGQTVPADLQAVFASLLLQVSYRSPYPELRCNFRANATQPHIAVSPLGHKQLRLTLPGPGERIPSSAELEILLAAGLARCASSSRLRFLLPRVLFVCSLVLIATSLSLAALDRRFLWGGSIALACCLISGCLFIVQQRSLAFQGDRVAVQWLGREHVCRGLHLLADYGQPRQRLSWGEPSVAERIARVCGTGTPTKDENLTLVC